ncbi:M48 family metallopeptidase [Pseudidiomarina sp.]|uniref:M48 family metallopeptidase n=1 Tax=Pseudidiomarina sp. TaxID=2081707 RepID=UPI003A98000F
MSAIYPIQRSPRRRSIAIKVRDGEVLVQAPQKMPDRQVYAFVQAKQAWIERHLREQRAVLQQLNKRAWQSGERLRWLGEPLQLEVQQASRKSCERIVQNLVATVTPRSNPAKEPRDLVRKWYQQQAQQWLDDFFRAWPSAHELQPKSWSVGSFSSKWGHCNRRGELKFSWKLWLAPEWVVRNVVIHELCHLREFNHSSRFWRLVAGYSNDYQQAEQWLRQHGMTVLNEAYLDYNDAP